MFFLISVTQAVRSSEQKLLQFLRLNRVRQTPFCLQYHKHVGEFNNRAPEAIARKLDNIPMYPVLVSRK
jgi:hypothetical protein